MLSREMQNRIANARRDLENVIKGTSFTAIRNNSVLLNPWTEAKNLASNWFDKSEPMFSRLDDSSIQPLVLFTEQISGIVDGRSRNQSESIQDALRRVRSQFQVTLPLLAFELLQASGILTLSDESLSK